MSQSFVDTMVGQTMNLDVSKTLAGARDLTGLCTDLFLIIIRMREAEDLGDPAALRKLINYYLDLFQKNCLAMKISQQSIDEARYALIALMDETVLSVPGACKDYWISRPMQLDYFGDNLAGEEFFNKLQNLLLQTESKKDVLEAYYLCLSLGFEGKYKLFNAEGRWAIMDDLGKKLRRTRIRASSELSPHGKRVDSEILRKKGVPLIPFWLTGALCGCGVAALWITFFTASGSRMSALVESIHSLIAK